MPLIQKPNLSRFWEVLVSRETGEVVFGQIHFSDNGVYQELKASFEDSGRATVAMGYTPGLLEACAMRRWGVCFLIAIVAVIAILAASQAMPVLAYLLVPGILLSYLISHSSDTSNFSFVAGMILNAASYTVLINLAAKRMGKTI